MANASHNKRPNKRPFVRGVSWLNFAKALRRDAVEGLTSKQVLDLIAAAAENEGKRVRGLR